jgi:hypothetical protein
METERPGAEQIATEPSNWILDFMGSIPTEIWVVVATAIFGLIGWFGRTAFDAWNKSRLPFKQDRDRYESVIASIDPLHFHYLKQAPMDAIGNLSLDGIDNACEQLSQLAVGKPAYLHKKLATKEKDLLSSVADLAEFLPSQLYPVGPNGNLFTMYWDTFDGWDGDQQRRAAAKQEEIMSKVDAAISAFEAYRDYGNKLFADKLVKEKSDG